MNISRGEGDLMRLLLDKNSEASLPLFTGWTLIPGSCVSEGPIISTRY